MKKIIYAISALLILVASQSCEKHVDRANKQVTIDTTLASGQVYQLNLAQYGDADDVATIVKQGAAYTTSAITNMPGVFSPLYSYSATTTKAALTDQVVLTVTEGSRNGSINPGRSFDSTIITINFTVK